MINIFIMVIHLLQWNARSLIANGQEFQSYVSELEPQPDILCVQETWLRPHLDFILPGYTSARYDRVDNQGGGYATFVKDNIVFRRLPSPADMECVIIEVCNTDVNTKIINFYNPCKKLSVEMFNTIKHDNRKEICYGDFNAHNSLWGSKHTDNNGNVVE